MDASLFIIQPAAAEPIYRQIVAQLRRLIASGQLAAGTRLPSVREVAAAHGVNPMTVSRAYGLAESDGLLIRQRGVGMVVAAARNDPTDIERRLKLIAPAIANLVREARELELPYAQIVERLAKDWENIE